MHNYEDDGVLTDDFYSEHIKKAPLFMRKDAIKLREFITTNVKHGDKTKIMYRIDNGKIRPSKQLASSLKNMIQGKQEFLMIDDQKIVFESILSIAKRAHNENQHHVIIVEGGPGTGKSVVAINTLVEAANRGLIAQYVTKNAAPRAVYESKLT